MSAAWLLSALLLTQSPLDQANKALLEGKYEQAYSLYQEVLKSSPNQYEALTNAAFAATKLGKSTEAFDLYWRAWQIQKDPQRVGKPLTDLGLRLGTRYILEKKWADAERAFRIVTTVAPDNAVAWFNLGYALENQGKLEEALTAYRKARDLNPTATVTSAITRVQDALDRQRTARLNAFRRRAERALTRGDTTLALAFIDSVLQLDRRNAWARSMKDTILKQRQFQAQVDSLRQVLAATLASDSVKALPVVNQLLSLVPEDSTLQALKASLESLRLRKIRAAAQAQQKPRKGAPIGLIVTGIVVLLLIAGVLFLLRGRRGEEISVPRPQRESPRPAPRAKVSPEPKPADRPEHEVPAETALTEVEPAPGPKRIRVVEGIPQEETGEEPTPKDVVIKPEEPKKPAEVTEEHGAPEEEVPMEEAAAPEAPRKPEPTPVAEEAITAEEKPAEPAPEEVRKPEPTPVAEGPTPEEAAPELPPEEPRKPEPTPVTEEPAPAKSQEETELPAEAPTEEKPAPPEPKPERKPVTARPRGFAGVSAIKERAKKKRRLMLLEMLREELAKGEEGVFGSKELEAHIYMKDGKIIQAEFQGKSGEEALQAILENPKPDRFSFRKKDTFFVEGDLNITVETLDQMIEELRKEIG